MVCVRCSNCIGRGVFIFFLAVLSSYVSVKYFARHFKQLRSSVNILMNTLQAEGVSMIQRISLLGGNVKASGSQVWI